MIMRSVSIKNGVATVIAGRANAGKSTLFNVLLNEERAILTDIAGRSTQFFYFKGQNRREK